MTLTFNLLQKKRMQDQVASKARSLQQIMEEKITNKQKKPLVETEKGVARKQCMDSLQNVKTLSTYQKKLKNSDNKIDQLKEEISELKQDNKQYRELNKKLQQAMLMKYFEKCEGN